MRDYTEAGYLFRADSDTPDDLDDDSDERPTMKTEIFSRLTADEIVERGDAIARAEARQNAWGRWALFWLAIGGLTGAAATLLVLEVWMTHGV